MPNHLPVMHPPPIALRLPRTLCLAGLLAVAGAASAQHAGTLKSVTGDVRLLEADRQQPASPGDLLRPGQRLRTGAQASAGITLTDGTLLAVGPNTTLALNEYNYEPTTRTGSLLLGLARGTLRMVSGLIGKAHPESVKVHTPTMTVGIRGTDFIVEVPGEEEK